MAWKPLERARLIRDPAQEEALIRDVMRRLRGKIDEAELREKIAEAHVCDVWQNLDYQVTVIVNPAGDALRCDRCADAAPPPGGSRREAPADRDRCCCGGAIERRPVNLVQLSVKRLDRRPVRDWRDLQRIKNQLLGPECEAVELFPAESRLVDTANQYHLWGFDLPGFRFEFGMGGDRVVMDADELDPATGVKQRPRQPIDRQHDEPVDGATWDPVELNRLAASGG